MEWFLTCSHFKHVSRLVFTSTGRLWLPLLQCGSRWDTCCPLGPPELPSGSLVSHTSNSQKCQSEAAPAWHQEMKTCDKTKWEQRTQVNPGPNFTFKPRSTLSVITPRNSLWLRQLSPSMSKSLKTVSSTFSDRLWPVAILTARLNCSTFRRTEKIVNFLNWETLNH